MSLVAILKIFLIKQNNLQQKLLPGQRPLYCEQKVEQRPCKAFLWRYTYDKTENKCKLFVFGGCSESLNIFRSKNLCEKTCKKSSVHETNNERAIESY